MSRLIYLFALVISGHIVAQTSTEELKVKAAIDTFFEGFHKGDTTLVKSVMMDKVILQTTFTDQQGKNHLRQDAIKNLLNAIASRKPNQKWDERLLDCKIQVDGSMANAWTPYEFYFNDQFSHCGVNSFQLFNDNGNWKIIYFIDTRRKEGCKTD